MRSSVPCITIALALAACTSPAGIGPEEHPEAVVRLVPPPGREDTPHGQKCNGLPFGMLMDNPDQWVNARECIDYMGYYCWLLSERYSDEKLIKYFDLLDGWDIGLSLEVAVVKDLDGLRTGEGSFTIESARWSRMRSLGADIRELTLDGPLCATLMSGLGDMSYAVKETADWIELTRGYFPGGVSISLIESYPIFVSKNVLIDFVIKLQQECAARGVEGINSLTLDYDWPLALDGLDISAPPPGTQPVGSWEEVLEIEKFCDSASLPFGLIYWPSLHPASSAGDIDFYNDIMLIGSSYSAIGGTPDIFAIQSWDYIPRTMCPETEQWTFTYSFLEFYSTYIQ